ncbi:30S ribosomal protein S20 [Rubrivirga sp. S365]|uniref:Small ribosomal subunit protein bS20 n=1 Tax=Rubrivirga litoralis TaxID=3075598 RepID=A0ABU3BM89_9BACT|nr:MULTISPECIES: 30S ribosomal protein S20 [unclassified Rubrivirga]MDT0630399.1 30S ribosomal protein S20 [Rubrivirga sp. F394]MDT7855910.1 30S ribosomal protein S20 [Rubrivirga sp. S365]
MPQHKSAAKRVRQDAKRRLRNRYQKVRLRTLVKEIQSETDPADAQAKLNAAKAQIDRLAGRRVVHPNTAARVKSQLERHVQTLG